MTYLYVLELPPRCLFDNGDYYIFQGIRAVLITAAALNRASALIRSFTVSVLYLKSSATVR